MFNAVFTCPIWGLYLNPEEELDGDNATSVYGVYMRTLAEGKSVGRRMTSVSYASVEHNVTNLYDLLNSLAIPKPVPVAPRGRLTIEAQIDSRPYFKSNYFVQPVIRYSQAENNFKKDATIELSETNLTKNGQRLGLNEKSNYFEYDLILDDIFKNAPFLLNDYNGQLGGMPPEFTQQFEKVIRHYYSGNKLISKFNTKTRCKTFWDRLRRRNKQ